MSQARMTTLRRCRFCGKVHQWTAAQLRQHVDTSHRKARAVFRLRPEDVTARVG